MKKTILMSVAVVALAASLFVGMASATVGTGMSPGFWKHNLGVYLGEANGSYSDSSNPAVNKNTMENFFDKLALGQTPYNPWDNEALNEPVDLELVYEGLCTKGQGAFGAGLRVNNANFLNSAADIYPYSG